jgi:hypothetical protein
LDSIDVKLGVIGKIVDVLLHSLLNVTVRISFSSQVYLILYSPPEEKQRFPEIFAKSRSTHFAKDRSSSLAMCISGIARPVPKIYWEVLDENGKLVSTLRPSTGPYSQNPPKIKSFDQSFYHEIALEVKKSKEF